MMLSMLSMSSVSAELCLGAARRAAPEPNEALKTGTAIVRPRVGRARSRRSRVT